MIELVSIRHDPRCMRNLISRCFCLVHNLWPFGCGDRKALELLHPQDGIGHDKNDGQEHIDKLFIGQLNS